MLVLTRKSGESFAMDSGLRVVVLKVNGSRVTLGVTAPPDVEVWRSELEAAPRSRPTTQVVQEELTHAGIDLRP